MSDQQTPAWNNIDETGNRYGRLVVVRRAASKGGQARWECQCDCGGTLVTHAKYLRRGHTNSCGCIYRYGVERDFVGNAALTEYFCCYRQNARKKGLEWDLTRAQCDILRREDCYYCGAPPSRVVGKNKGSTRVPIVVNGIDRVDNREGYFLGNVVPCCKDCNMAKAMRSVAEFAAWVVRVHRMMQQRGLIEGEQPPHQKAAQSASRPRTASKRTRAGLHTGQGSFLEEYDEA